MNKHSIQSQINHATGGLAALSIRHPIGVVMITLAIMLLGLFSLGRLSVDLLPHIIYPNVNIRISYPGVPANIIEEKITRQLEEQLAITEDVISIESTSGEGRSRVNLTFQYGKDIDIALRDASTRLDRAKRFLPEGIESPIIYKRDPSQRAVLEYVISSSTRNPVKLRDWVDNIFSKWFINLPGVASAEVGGGLVREIQVLPDQQRMAGLGLTTDNIIDALKQSNLDTPTGRIKLEQRELGGRVTARFNSVQEIGQLPILLSNGSTIKLQDIAQVIDTHKDETIRVRLDGLPGVKMSIQKQPNANSIAVVDAVRKRLATLKLQHVIPDDIQINVIGDQSIYVRHSLNNASTAAFSGAMLAMLVVYLFLGNLKRTLIIGTAIPIAITVTFLLMDIAGLSLNIMTLGGLAVGIGMLVDSTIVMLENIYRHQSEGEDRFTAGISAASEVNSAIVASTSTNLAAIIPFLFIGGFIGLFFRELIFTITAAIVAAMLVALTVVPTLATNLKLTTSKASSFSGRWALKLQTAYANSIRMLLSSHIAQFLLLICLLVSLAVSLPVFSSKTPVFLPKIDDGKISVRIKADPGVKLDITDQAVTRIETLINQMPHVTKVYALAGGFIFGRTEIEARHYGRLEIQLTPRSQRKMSSEQWLMKFRKLLSKNRSPGVRVYTYQTGIPGIRKQRGNDDVSLRISGPSLDILNKLATQTAEILRTVKGLRNVSSSAEETGQELAIIIDRERAIALGFTIEKISQLIRTAVNGIVATDYLEDDRAYNIRVKLPTPDLSSLASLESLLLGKSATQNTPVYLSGVAHIELIQTPSSIVHDSQRRIVEINASFSEDTDGGTILQDMKQSLKNLSLPDGYQLYDAGISESLKDNQATIKQLLFMAFFLVFVVMAVQYESLRNPVIILLGVPFAGIGVAIAISSMELPLSMPMWLGVIMLAGIVVNNAIVLLEYIGLLRERGVALNQAIIQAAKLRIRPILMTSLTTIIGLMPLALGLGEGAEMLQPLAITIISGLAFSLLVSLYLIPVIYRMFYLSANASS